MATKKSNSEHSETTQIIQTRTEHLAQIQTIVAVIEPRLKKVKVGGYQRDQLNLLESVSLGLYDEVDKLSKKAPTVEATDLVLTQMNEVIRETKELVTDDPYVQRLQEFIPAGDNPQHRDAVVVMRQVRQGLERFRQQLDPLAKQLEDYLMDAKGIERALQLYLDGHEVITDKELRSYDVKVSATWLTDSHPKNIDFNKLDKINISAYFGISNE